MIDHYDWAGGREAMLRFGPPRDNGTGPVVIAALPLFEEANRTRAFVVTILRALAAKGIATALPDLPGQGESSTATDSMTAMQLREAYEAAVNMLRGQGLRPHAVAIRSGALLDTLALVDSRWHLAPINGQELLHDLGRIRQAAGEVFDPRPDEDGPPVPIAGNLVNPILLAELHRISPMQSDGVDTLRTVRLASDPRPADRHVPGAPLWRRAEPGNDPALAALLAADIADWIACCEG